jgi:phospholipid/cholesterol/gamma-HCH transport system substrate-binding protein
MNTRRVRISLAVALVAVLVAALFVVNWAVDRANRATVIGYFANTNGMFVGDDVRILGVPVGRVEKIEPQPQQVKVTFFYDERYKVPADAKAVILSPSLVTSRAIQLTPAYTGGPVMANNAVIPLQRTAVPVEFDDFRRQLDKLADSLQPTQPGGLSPLGSFVKTTADNLRGRGAEIRNAVIELSHALSALNDHSTDLFSSIKNLAIVVSALRDSTEVMRELNRNLAAVTGLLADTPDEVGQALADIDSVDDDVRSFVADNRDALGTTAEKLASITTALVASEDDIKQTLHIAPNAFQNFVNIYQPAQAVIGGAVALNMFSNPITFLCGAVQAASRLGAEQASKLCVQYLAPIIKNRQYNFPPIGENLFVGAQARPNEITYSEDWLRPNYVPPHAPAAAPVKPLPDVPPAGTVPTDTPPRAAEAPPPPGGAAPAGPAAPHPNDPSAGLAGLMTPATGGPS